MANFRIFSVINRQFILLTLLSLIPALAPAQGSAYNFATGHVKGKNHVGGLIGGITSNGAILRDSYARGSVTGESGIGGLAGNSNGTVVNTYSTGSVTGTSLTGGLLGSSTGTVTSSWWDNQTSGQTSSAGGASGATDPMTYPYSPAVYTGWDFTSVWKADTDPKQNDGYPLLHPSVVYLVSVQVFPPGSGTATGAGYSRGNGQVQLDAAPGSSYVFKGWVKNGQVVSSNARFTMAVTENTALVARFESKTTAMSAVQVQPSSGIKIYPNPVRELLRLDVTSVREEISSVQVVNMNGQVLKSFRGEQLTQSQWAFPVADLRPGVYMIVFGFGSGLTTERFIKY